jgi:hypothetical protein
MNAIGNDKDEPPAGWVDQFPVVTYPRRAGQPPQDWPGLACVVAIPQPPMADIPEGSYALAQQPELPDLLTPQGHRLGIVDHQREIEGRLAVRDQCRKPQLLLGAQFGRPFLVKDVPGG